MAETLRLWRHARLATCDAAARRIERGALLTRGARIEWVGEEQALPAVTPDESHDLGGAWVTPALIDCHTHLVFAGNRAAEYAERLRGRSYADIARAGGGILSSVRALRAASEQQLFDESAPRLAAFLAEGVTTIEIKSGYGLTLEDEAKMLRVARELGRAFPVTVRTTLLAAHTVPPEYQGRADDYIDAVAREWLPALAHAGLVDAVDVFCEGIAFSVDECRRLLVRARELGFAVKLHADQLTRGGGARLAAELGALSADHLECANEEDWGMLARAGVVGVLLPAAALTLGQRLPHASLLRRSGARVAIATDFNPGTAPAQSLLECGALAARLCGFDAEETLMALTWNAAKALGVEAEVGHLSPGAAGDAVVWECETLDELPYWMPAVRPDTVFVRGADLALPALERRVWP